jgi:CMP/dCMP kinase
LRKNIISAFFCRFKTFGAMKTKPIIITIDGPAGVGKSTHARRLAEALGLYFADTGALYRALTWKALRLNLNVKDEKSIKKMLGQTRLQVKVNRAKHHLTLWLDGRKVGGEIRAEKINQNVSDVAAWPSVRRFLKKPQQDLGRQVSLVMEGRDIGTAIFPRARLKIYLTASALARGKRRYLELCQKGEKVSLPAIVRSVRARDRKDRLRKIAPLRCPKNAVVLDSTRWDLEATFRNLILCVRRHIPELQ